MRDMREMRERERTDSDVLFLGMIHPELILSKWPVELQWSDTIHLISLS